MKKLLIAMLILPLLCPKIHARHDGGAAVVGALGGLAVGTMIGTAAASDSKKSSRAEHEAIRAQEKAERAQERAEQVRIEQEQQRVDKLERELERRELEHKLAQTQAQGGNTTFMILIVLVALLMMAVIGLSVVIFKRKP